MIPFFIQSQDDATLISVILLAITVLELYERTEPAMHAKKFPALLPSVYMLLPREEVYNDAVALIPSRDEQIAHNQVFTFHVHPVLAALARQRTPAPANMTLPPNT